MALRDLLGFPQTERQKWAASLAATQPQSHVGLPALDAQGALLYGAALPRGVLMPRAVPSRPAVNHWMSPGDVQANFRFGPGAILLGKLGNTLLGHRDDRPLVTIAGARAGKSSTVLEANLMTYGGSMVVTDPKGELAARTAALRRALGHDVYVLDPFGQSGEPSASFNLLAELDPDSNMIVDDVASISQAIIVDEGDAKSKHWNESARALVDGIMLLTLTLPKPQRNMVTVRQLLSLTHPALVDAVKGARARRRQAGAEKLGSERLEAMETLFLTMKGKGDRFRGILAAIGARFGETPHGERGSIFSTAAVNTDFLNSIPLRDISGHSDFALSALRSDRPTTIYLCLPVGRMESHYRWLRMIVQQACTTLEKFGSYPRVRLPILFMMEEFTTLGHMDIMERAAAYFPGFGVKLWAILQDTTQLRRNYHSGWETFLGNAGVIQCFANGDQTTLDYISRRVEELIMPFELRTAFSRDSFAQMLMVEGLPPAAAIRLSHQDVAEIRRRVASGPRLLAASA